VPVRASPLIDWRTPRPGRGGVGLLRSPRFRTFLDGLRVFGRLLTVSSMAARFADGAVLASSSMPTGRSLARRTWTRAVSSPTSLGSPLRRVIPIARVSSSRASLADRESLILTFRSLLEPLSPRSSGTAVKTIHQQGDPTLGCRYSPPLHGGRGGLLCNFGGEPMRNVSASPADASRVD